MPVGRSNPSRSLRLALLAPDIVEAILGGWADQRVMLETLERPLPVRVGGAAVCRIGHGSRRLGRRLLMGADRLPNSVAA